MRLGRQRDLGELAKAFRFDRGGHGEPQDILEPAGGSTGRGAAEEVAESWGGSGSHELLGWGSRDSLTQGARRSGKGTQGWRLSGVPREEEGQESKARQPGWKQGLRHKASWLGPQVRHFLAVWLWASNLTLLSLLVKRDNSTCSVRLWKLT